MKFRLTIAFFINVIGQLYSQDVHFSQMANTPLLVNPGNTALNNDLRAIINYKQQWNSVGAPFQTSNVSFDIATTKDKRKNAFIGLGIDVFNDNSGDSKLNQTQGNLNLSSVIKMDAKNRFSIGLMGGFGQRSIDFSNLRWESQYDGSYDASLSSNESFYNSSYAYFDAGAGLVWSYGEGQSFIGANDGVIVNFGVSAFHFGLPQATFNKLLTEKTNSRITVFGNLELGKENHHLTYIPSFYVNVQGKLNEIVYGSNFRYLLKEGAHFTGFTKSSAVFIGVHHRWNDAVIIGAGVDYANYSICFSYDLNVSKLTQASNFRGGFELCLKFVTPNPFTKV